MHDYEDIMSAYLGEPVEAPLENMTIIVENIEVRAPAPTVTYRKKILPSAPTASVRGLLLGVDRETLTRYLVEHDHIVGGGAVPVCRWAEGREPHHAGYGSPGCLYRNLDAQQLHVSHAQVARAAGDGASCIATGRAAGASAGNDGARRESRGADNITARYGWFMK